MIGIKQLRLRSAQTRVAQPHRCTARMAYRSGKSASKFEHCRSSPYLPRYWWLCSYSHLP